MMCVPHGWWSNLYGVGFALAAAALCLRGQRVDKGELPLLVGWGVFLAWCFVTAPGAFSPAGALRVAVFYLAGAALMGCARGVFRTAEDARILFGWIYAALLFTAVYGFAIYALGRDGYGAAVDDSIVPRLGSTLEHGINYGEFAAMAFPGAIGFALDRRGQAHRLFAAALLLLPAAAIALTYARTGWIALAFSLGIVLYTRRKRALIPSAAVAAALLTLLPGSVAARALSMLTWSDSAASGRFTLWRECLAMLRSHWLLGVGLGPQNFYRAYLPFSTGKLPFAPPHANMGYLEMSLSLGILGGTAYLVFFFGVFFCLRRAYRRAEGEQRRAISVTGAALAGAALANIPEHLWFYPRVYFFWCVLYGLALGLAGEDQQPPEDTDGCDRAPDQENTMVVLSMAQDSENSGRNTKPISCSAGTARRKPQ